MLKKQALVLDGHSDMLHVDAMARSAEPLARNSGWWAFGPFTEDGRLFLAGLLQEQFPPYGQALSHCPN